MVSNKRILPVLIAAVLILSVYGAVRLSHRFGSAQGPILFVPNSVDKKFEFWQVMNQGVNTAAKEYNVQVKVEGTASEKDVEGQIRLLQQAVSTNPRAIILAATDYNKLVPAARQIIRSGIKLVTVDSELKGSLSSSFIATDNYEAGRKAGETMEKWAGPSAHLAIISFVKGSGPAIDRERGVRESLKPFGAIRLTPTYYCDGSVKKAYATAKSLIQDDPSLYGIIGLNEYSTAGAAKAIRDLNAAGRVKLVGFDSSMEEIAALEDGVLQAAIVQKPFNVGYLAVKTAIRVSAGQTVKRRIDTGAVVVTKENMYSSENQKLLFPFEEK